MERTRGTLQAGRCLAQTHASATSTREGYRCACAREHGSARVCLKANMCHKQCACACACAQVAHMLLLPCYPATLRTHVCLLRLWPPAAATVSKVRVPSAQLCFRESKLGCNHAPESRRHTYALQVSPVHARAHMRTLNTHTQVDHEKDAHTQNAHSRTNTRTNTRTHTHTGQALG